MSEVFDILQGYINEAAAKHNLSPRLLSSMVHAESSYRPDATSPAGALGAMQLMPKTAESLGVTDPLDPQQNIDAGARYMRQLLDMFDGDVDMALAAYHEGPTKVRKLGRVPRRKVTKDYIQKVRKYKQNPDKLRDMYQKSNKTN